MKPDVYAADCPTRQILDRVGDKWAVLILLLLREKPMRFNQLRRNSNPVAGAHYRPFDHGIHSEFSRDFRQRTLRIFVTFYRRVRNHPEAAGLGKIGDQLIGHAIAKVFLLWIRGKIAEWEHSQGLNSMSARASNPSIAKMVPIKCK